MFSLGPSLVSPYVYNRNHLHTLGVGVSSSSHFLVSIQLESLSLGVSYASAGVRGTHQHSAAVREGPGMGGHIVYREGECDAQSLREEPACLEDMQAALHGASGDMAREGSEGTTV